MMTRLKTWCHVPVSWPASCMPLALVKNSRPDTESRLVEIRVTSVVSDGVD